MNRRARRWTVASVVGVAVIVAVRLVVPCPIDGYWKGTWVTCSCGSHSYAMFESGHGTLYERYHDDYAVRSRCAKIGHNTWRWEPLFGVIAPDRSGWTINTNDFILLTPGWCYMTAARPDGTTLGFLRIPGPWNASGILKTKHLETPEQQTERILVELKARKARKAEVQHANSN